MASRSAKKIVVDSDLSETKYTKLILQFPLSHFTFFSAHFLISRVGSGFLFSSTKIKARCLTTCILRFSFVFIHNRRYKFGCHFLCKMIKNSAPSHDIVQGYNEHCSSTPQRNRKKRERATRSIA